MRQIKHIVVHCTATPPSVDWDADDLRRFFTSPKPEGRGWTRAGYHYVIPRDGRLQELEPEDRIAYGARGYNETSIHVALVGGVTEHGGPAHNYQPAQNATLNVAIAFLSLKYPAASVVGHRDLPGVAKDCPSFDVAVWRRTGNFASPRKSPALNS